MGYYYLTSKRISSGVLALLFAMSTLSLLIASSLGNPAIEAATTSEGFEKEFTSKEYVHHGTNAKFVHVSSNSQARTGARSLKIISTNSDPGIKKLSELTRWMTNIEKLSTTPGEQVSVEVYLKGEGIVEQAELAVSFFGDKGSGTWGEAWLRTATSVKSITGTSDWTLVKLKFDVPQGAKYVRPEFRLWDKGTLWIDDFSISTSGDDVGVDGGNKDVQVFETPNSQGQDQGAQVVLGDKDYIWVNATCKGHLIDDGNKVQQSTWAALNDKYNQLKTGSLSCAQVRMYNAVSPPAPVEDDEPEEPGVVVGPEEPVAGIDQSAIPYTGPNQYDWSVIPIDDVVSTTVHGINKSAGQQLFTVDCLHSHYRGDDPIVFPGQTGASHNHEFFGDMHLNANTTIEQMISNPANTCEVGADRSAYWVPAVYQDGKTVEADNNKFYYKVGKVDPTTIQPMPVGLRMIAGNAKATEPESRQVKYLFATTSEGKHTEPHTQMTGGSKTLFTTRPDENGVRVQIQFPQCWDGKNLWLPNTAHMSYPIGSKCPSTHPVPLLQLMFNLGYSDATGGKGFKLSSGEWYTAHADFINGWHPETMERLVDVCLRDKRYCGLTQSEPRVPCAGKSSVKSNKIGCIELRKGESSPRFFGQQFN